MSTALFSGDVLGEKLERIPAVGPLLLIDERVTLLREITDPLATIRERTGDNPIGLRHVFLLAIQDLEASVVGVSQLALGHGIIV